MKEQKGQHRAPSRALDVYVATVNLHVEGAKNGESHVAPDIEDLDAVSNRLADSFEPY